MIVLTLSLALLWTLLTGEFTPMNFLIGFAAAGALLWFVRRVRPVESPREQRGLGALLRQAVAGVEFGLFFIWALILANVRVAIDVLRPRPRLQPAVVAVPLHGYSDVETTLLANFITLTPGTLSLDVVRTEAVGEAAARTLYVHAMHAGHTQAAIDGFRKQLQASVGRRVQEVL